MLSSANPIFSSPKGGGGGGFNNLESPRGGNFISTEADFHFKVIQQHLDIGSLSPTNSSSEKQRTSSLQPLSQKPSYLPLSPSHQHFHMLMSSRQYCQTLPPIESSPTNRQSSNNFETGFFPKKSIHLDDNQSTKIKEKPKIQLYDIHKSNPSFDLRQSHSADNLDSKYTPLSARVRNAEKEWESQLMPPPNVSRSWVAPQRRENEGNGSPGHRWNLRMDKKLRDLEFHYSGGPTRVCHMQYLNDPNTEVRIPYKIDTEMPAETIKPPLREKKKKKKLDKTKVIETKLVKSKMETQRAIEEMERKKEQLDFLHRLAIRSVD